MPHYTLPVPTFVVFPDSNRYTVMVQREESENLFGHYGSRSEALIAIALHCSWEASADRGFIVDCVRVAPNFNRKQG